MRCGILLLVVLGVTGCPGGDGGVGETCSSHGDCKDTLQCSQDTCVPRCARAPECGDGYACDSDGICTIATGQPGDSCTSETHCSPGLSCQIDGDSLDEDNHLLASCTAQREGKPAGGECTRDEDCRNNTCALGRCTDLCSDVRDCAAGYACMDIPRIQVNGALYSGCLPASGNVIWSIPVTAPTSTILLPVPSAAHYAQLVFAVDDDAQRVGAHTLTSPAGATLYSRPCDVLTANCDPVAEYFANIVRHEPELGQSVLALPTMPGALETGAYRVQVSSYRATGAAGSAIPRITALVRIDTATLLDLRFHFLDLDEHMCQQTAFGNTLLDAKAAQTAPFFQNDFVGELRAIFAHGGVALGNLTYDDILTRPDLDSLDVDNAKDLLTLGTGGTGIDVFFVRSLSPVGLQAFGPNPGPAGLSHTRQSGIVIGLDTLCFRSWKQLARLTAHELARYMGLQHNRELADSDGTFFEDMIDDSDNSENNLMFFSELGGIDISPGQRDILTRSGVLR